ncbi:aspartic peptidase domain-containing protein [Hyaloscypha finlandica]|nr:aspartic peptidase domain-containing protein [Hyaloscypha finlandica]KAH8786428.1 aspartic peptidase domain-containing protein [Hyaloscypha sp. PMI_1271]
MKAPTASAILSIAALSSCAFAAVSMNIVKDRDQTPKFRRRGLLPRASITETLANNATGGDYIATAKVGTPAQTVTFLIDTGSSDVWMLAASSDLCTTPSLQSQTGGCSSTFNEKKSTTYKLAAEGAFDITYVDNTGAKGDYINDTFSIGGATIKALEMGLAYTTTSSTGVMGIGYSLNEASDDPRTQEVPFVYPSIIETMVSQGLINTKAYSLYLDDLEASSGSIIFGGVDTQKFEGTLTQLPIVGLDLQNGSSVYSDFGVTMSAMGITGKTLTNSTYADVAILDSGTTLTYVAPDLMALIVTALGGVDDTAQTQNIYVNCDLRNTAAMTFDFAFGGATIRVPASEMILDLKGTFAIPEIDLPSLPFKSVCALGIQGGEAPYLLGDTFLRSAYVVYDLKNNLIGIAQTNFGSTKTNVVELQASATSIPNLSGVTGSSSPSTSTSTSTNTKNAGAPTIPGFDVRRLVVLGLSAGFAVLGGFLV